MGAVQTYHQLPEGFKYHQSELRKTHETLFKDALVFSHYGDFTHDFITSISDTIEPLLIEEQLPKNLVKRVFSLLVEGLQNIRKHGLQNTEGTKSGHLIIQSHDSKCLVSFGNYISKNDKTLLSSHLEELKKQDKALLKRNYLKLLRDSFISKNEQAKLGLISIFMNSNIHIEYSFIPVSKDVFYFEFLATVQE